MSSGAHVTAIVVAYRGVERLDTCLRALHASALPCPLDILVVANAPTPAVDEVLDRAERDLGARVVRSTVNRGLAGGLRLGRHCAAPTTTHLVVVQDDVEVAPHSLGGLLDALTAEPSAAAAHARTMRPDGTLEREAMCLLAD